jgi:hypothetical protein
MATTHSTHRPRNAEWLGLAMTCTLAACALPSCVATAPSAPPRGVVVSGPPPAPLEEARPAPPPNRTAWVSGYWHWTGMHYAWIPGHWDAAPQGSRWVAPRYFQQGGQYLYESGGWSRGLRRGGDR